MASINIKKNGQWTGNPVLGFKVGEENLTDDLKEKIANGADVDLSDYATKDELNNLTAEDVGAVSKAGDTMNGNLNINTDVPAVNLQTPLGNSRVFKNANADENYGLFIEDTESNGDTAQLYLKASNEPSNALNLYLSNKNAIYNILHTGNKSLIAPADIGAAATSHNHAAGDITSGTLPFERGGTGASTALVNAPVNAIIRKPTDGNYLYYTATNNGAFYATSTNGLPKFGTLPIAQGGTGATSASAACTNLGLSPAMNLGTEYATVEKYQGKVVYTKLVSYGGMPNTNRYAVSHGASATQILRCAGMNITTGMNIPCDTVSVFADKSSITIITTANQNNSRAYVQIWYTKD